MRLIPTLALCALLSACGLVKVKGGLATNANPAMPGFCTAGPPVRSLAQGSLYSDWR